MKPCETCKFFNINLDDYCVVDAFVEDGKPCSYYHTTKSLDRLVDLIEKTNVIATEICETSDDCSSSCNCCIGKECVYDILWKLSSSLKHKKEYTKGE